MREARAAAAAFKVSGCVCLQRSQEWSSGKC